MAPQIKSLIFLCALSSICLGLAILHGDDLFMVIFAAPATFAGLEATDGLSPTGTCSSRQMLPTVQLSCPWRIRKSSQKWTGAGSLVRCRHRATVHVDDSPAHTLRPPATIAKLVRPGGVRVVVAESLLIKQQLLISSRARRRVPNLNSFDRFVFGLGSLFVPASRIPKLAVKPRTLLRFHEALKNRKYRWLFSSGGHRGPGPKGPSMELIDAIVELERRNPRVGCPRIAQEIARAFGIDIDKDIVRRVLAKHYRPEAGTDGPSWLSFIGHMKDSLWSVDLFRCDRYCCAAIGSWW
jgi:hypothetical protein